MYNYDDTIKSVKNNVDAVVQDINMNASEIQKSKQLRVQLCNHQVTELVKPSMDENITIYVYRIRDISTKCRTRYPLTVSPEKLLEHG